MASGTASSHRGLAGTGRAFRLQLLLRVRVGEEVGHALVYLQVSRRPYRMQAGRRGVLDAHKGRYAMPNPAAHSTAARFAGLLRRELLRWSRSSAGARDIVESPRVSRSDRPARTTGAKGGSR